MGGHGLGIREEGNHAMKKLFEVAYYEETVTRYRVEAKDKLEAVQKVQSKHNGCPSPDVVEGRPDYVKGEFEVRLEERRKKSFHVEHEVKPTMKLRETILSSDWCECKKPEFSSYPEDGQCRCGMHKHHVHCVCGKISQIG